MKEKSKFLCKLGRFEVTSMLCHYTGLRLEWYKNQV